MTDRYIYFIKPINADGPIKVGSAYSPEDRLKRLQSKSDDTLELVGYVPGIFPDETYILQQLFQHRSHGEWFFPTPEVTAAMQQVLAAGRVDRNIPLARFMRGIKEPARSS